MKKNTSHFAIMFIRYLLVYLLFTNAIHAEETVNIPLPSGNEIAVEKYASSGEYLIVWITPEYGIREGHRAFARLLTEQNIEVWHSNVIESLFLENNSTSIKNLDGKNVADLIEYAHKTTGKKIIVSGDSFSILSALQGARQWQTRKIAKPYFVGAVLFTPNAYSSIPPLGQLPQYMPIVSSTNIPIMIYQIKNHRNIGQFDTLIEKLQQHDNPVYSRMITNTMTRHHDKEPLTTEMKKTIRPLIKNIKKMLPVLARHNIPTNVIPIKKINENKSGTDTYLKAYKGLAKPYPINLKDAYGKTIYKKTYKGKVTVINFWATWCPPCVEEIPSLNRLKRKMAGLPFELISINYAEDNKTIIDFLKKVNVEFPVLLDLDGSFAKKWNIIAYPSTFVIDPNGNIVFGVNAAIEWDNDKIIKKLKSFL